MTKASSFSGPPIRPARPAGGFAHAAIATGRDHFREQAERKAAKKAAPKGDAFIPKPKPAAGPVDMKPRAAAMRAERVDDDRELLEPQPQRRILSNGKPLEVVERRDDAVSGLWIGRGESAVARPVKTAAKSSSLVLVSSAASAETAEKPVERVIEVEATPIPTPTYEKPYPRSGGGGGAGGGAGGGGVRPPTPQIDRAFNQDDLIAILMVLALLLLGSLYFFREGGSAPPQKLVGVQSAANEPALPPAPPAPPKDPFGDQPIDLRPKPVEAAPPPVSAPACSAGHVMRAFFCTDKSQLTDKAKVALEKELADWNACFKDRELVVTGYADTRGPNVYNTWLGGERAKVVADFLRSRGVKVAQLSGVGELDGLADNENCSNQRRVDISFAGETPETPSRSCAPPDEMAALICG